MIIGGNSENSTRSRRNGTAVEEKGTASVTRETQQLREKAAERAAERDEHSREAAAERAV